jgi:hypothetical protein
VLPALNEGSVFGLGIWIGHGEEVDEDHMVTLQIVLTTVDKEWIFVPRLALPQQQTIIADEQLADAAPLESVKAAAPSGVTVVRRPQTAAPDLLMLMLSSSCTVGRSACANVLVAAIRARSCPMSSRPAG